LTPERWAQIEGLFHRAARCDPKQRINLLQEACRGDVELRHAVERLLSSQEGASADMQAAVRMAVDAAVFPLVGETLSHYRILEGLGGGGMGLLYKAQDLRLGRRVALKFLPEESAKNPTALDRFEREARSASALEHPNICPIYEFGEHEGQPFLVMQLLEGQTLGEFIAHRAGHAPFPLDKLLDLAIQVASGLEAAHGYGITHRDIKPANIFVTKQEQAKILDFGLAKTTALQSLEQDLEQAPDVAREGNGISEVATANIPDPLLSRTGAAMGTAGYMSPEQIRAEQLDGRTDIFSFGLVLYEMATGQRAFAGETAADLRDTILNHTPTPVRKLNPEMPLKLEQIINHALEKDRRLRYQRVSDMRTELQHLKRQTESAESRPRKLWVVLAACLIIGLAAVGLWHRAAGRTVQIDSIAVLPFTNVTGDANSEYVSDGITESLISSFTHVPELKVKSRDTVFRYKGKSVDARKVGGELGVTALVTGRVTQRGDSVEVSAALTRLPDSSEIWRQHYHGKSTDIISLQKQIAGDIAGKLRSKLTSSEKLHVIETGTQNPDAYDLYMKGRFSWNTRTLPDMATAISYYNRAIAKDPNFALAYAGLADAYSVLPGHGGTPTENYPKSNAAARKALELDATLAHPHAVLAANEMQYDWDFAGGEAEYKKAFELDPNDATAHQWYAQTLAIMGREQEAIDEINRAQQLDPLSPIINAQRGLIDNMARRFDEAIDVCSKLANEYPTFAVVHAYLAQAYWGKRMYPQVIAEWKIYGQLSGNRNESEFAFAMEQGFRSVGWKTALAKGIEARLAQRKVGYSSAYRIALNYADLGNKDQAFRWLDIAYRERDLYLLGLKTDCLLDPLRSDPRFAALMGKVGLPQ
jgi:serine/threonine-protein kinase